jgi:SAM-dependent methyltransferase
MNYWDSFGFEWSHWSQTQLDGPGRDESEKTFRLKTGLIPQDVKGKVVLDVGCGMGRFLEVVSRWGANRAVGLEPSDAWIAAEENLKDRSNCAVWPGALDDEVVHSTPNFFDIVYCLGVLHHTPDPAASFRNIARLVKPGGMLCVWVYSRDMGVWTKVTDFYRKVTVHLPWPILRAICLIAAPWDYVRRIPAVGKWIWGLFPCSTHPDWRWRWLDTFDWYSPRYQFKHTVAEVKSWFIDEGFTDIEVLPVPVSVRGRRPPTGEGKRSRLVDAGFCRVYERDPA